MSVIYGAAIYTQAGAVTDRTEGWTFIPSVSAGKKVYQEAEGYYSDKGGQLLGPLVATDQNEFAYYQCCFDARAPRGGYWGASFEDKMGRAIVSDNYSSLYPHPEKQHYEQVLYGRENAVGMHPFFQSVAGIEVWNLEIKPISVDWVAEWCDLLYQTLPRVERGAPSDRLKEIPRTVEAMKNGKPWRVVMLGDSIVNDTFNSNFQALWKQAYPKAELQFICSVRGSTGCWYYQEPEAFKKYIQELRPDLLMIGGISHRDDAKGISQVIRMTKEKVGCEIVLMTGPLGKDWRAHEGSQEATALSVQKWSPNPFIEKQRQIAEEMKIGFWDLESEWHHYLGGSKKPWRWYQRDEVHGNDRGKQIIARILERIVKEPNEGKIFSEPNDLK